MNINGRITILINREDTDIEICDMSSGITFCKIKLTAQQFSSALSRLAQTECESVVVKNLDLVGKKMENKYFEFQLPEDWRPYSKEYTSEDLRKIAQDQLTDGWIADGYFGSKGSFFSKDKKNYGRVVIRRWI